MTHPTDRLVLYVSGELPGDEAAGITRHLAECGVCGQAVAEIAAVDARLRALSFSEPAEVRVPPAVSRWWSGRTAVVAAASLLIGVAAGLWAQSATGRTIASPSDERPRFMLTFHEPVSERLALDDVTRRERGQRMIAWVSDLRESGAFVGGQKLRDEGGRIESLAGVDDQVGRVPDGEMVSGYFIIAAADYDEATRLARASPIVAVGGRVSVRALQ